MKKTSLNLVVCKSEDEAKHIQELIKVHNAGYTQGCKEMRNGFIKGALIAIPIVTIIDNINWKKVKAKIKAKRFKVTPN